MAVGTNAPTDVKKRLVTAAAREKYLGMEILCLVYCSQFGELVSGLQNEYVKGNDNYSSDMTDKYNIMNHYISYTNHRQYLHDLEEVDFSQ